MMKVGVSGIALLEGMLARRNRAQFICLANGCAYGSKVPGGAGEWLSLRTPGPYGFPEAARPFPARGETFPVLGVGNFLISDELSVV